MQEFVAEALTPEPCFLGECCRYDEVRQELSWVDLDAGRFFRARVDGPRVELVATYEVGGALGALAPYAQRERGWLCAIDQGLATLSLDGTVTTLCEPEAHHRGVVRMNDGAADPWGRFWIGTMAYDSAPGKGTLYRYDPADGSVATILTGATIANGLGWSPDAARFYFVDSIPGTLDVFDVDARGDVANRQTLVAFDGPREGYPDGLCLDAEGCVWVALWGGSAVRRYSPDGELLATVAVGATQPACCAIGGAGGTTLYVTTAREDLTPAQLEADPDAGRMFACEVGVAGAPLETVGPR
jgi:sugar lactone lactonase YvrE